MDRRSSRVKRRDGNRRPAATLFSERAVLDVDGFEVDIQCTLPPGFCACSMIDDLLKSLAGEQRLLFGFEHTGSSSTTMP